MKEPSGNVTFLFTDIEGSTKLAQMFPQAYPAALNTHHSILQKEIESNNGFVFKIIGDAFCCAFQNAADAVKAAVMAQKKLAADKWDDAVIKIRIGIHSGAAVWNGEHYVGYITLARTARVMSSAYGEQIIISNDTYELISGSSASPLRHEDTKTENKNFVSLCLSGDITISFRDLGLRRLKDVTQPIRLFQVLSPGLREDFPPLKTLDSRPNNVPVQLSSFIGREKEMIQIKTYLSNTRFLTLLGPGGTGKTRLSLQVGADVIDDFANGVWFVELAALSDPLLITAEIVSVFKLKSDGNKDNFEIIKNFLREKELLLILDNCEHLIKECAKISEQLLLSCPKLKILSSSREPFHISGEMTYAVPSLELPDTKINYTADTISRNESASLFINRALAVNPNFKVTNSNASALAQLCNDLDGIPLAIELAAARIRVLTIEKIIERLNDRFSLLTAGKRTSLPRQQTIRALIDWSYDLLSEKEKLMFQRLSIFCGGCTLEAAESICSDELTEYEILDLISNLVDKSLVRVSESEYETRYTMLETIRKYGLEKLNASEYNSRLQKKYFDFFYKFVEDSESGLTGSEQKEWIKKITSEIENIRESIRWSLNNNHESALQISVSMGKFWELQSHFAEGLKIFQECLARSDSAEVIMKAKALYWTGFFLLSLGKYSESRKYLNESLGIFTEMKNKDGQAVTLIALATISLYEGDYEKLKDFLNQSLLLSYEINNKSYIAINLRCYGVGLMQQGEHLESRKKYEESLALFRELNDSIQIAKIIGNIGALETLTGNYKNAVISLEESLSLRKELGDRQGAALALNNLGTAHYMQRNFDKAQLFYEECLAVLKELGDRRIYINLLCNLGNVANEKEDFTNAIKLFIESIEISKNIGDKYVLAKGIEGLATSHLKLKHFKKACIISAKYIGLLESAKTNLIDQEIATIENFKSVLKSNLSESEFEEYWSEGEAMSIEEAIDIALSGE